jgi:uncharacterized protein (DUF2141 family)
LYLYCFIMKIKILMIAIVCLQWASNALFGQQTTSPNGGVLSVMISNFKNDKGTAVVTLYNNSEGFPKSPEKALKKMTIRIVNRQAMAEFEGLPPGEYAVSVYHDENGNKKMDTNFFGIPKEGVGNSNNAKGHFGPPKYSDARFNFNGEKQTITIKIVYL